MRYLPILLVAILAVVPAGAMAQEGVSATASPDALEPGDNVDLILRIQEPELIEANVQEHVSCTITFPSGEERQPCDRTSALVDVRTSGSGTREYVFDYQAPDEVGDYQVTMRADATLRLFPQTYQASTTFTVVEDLANTDDGSQGDDGNGDGGGNGGAPGNGGSGSGSGGSGESGGSEEGSEDDSGGDAGDSPDDEAGDVPGTGGADLSDAFPDVPKMVGDVFNSPETRAIVSTTMAGGVIGLALVANRWPLGRR